MSYLREIIERDLGTTLEGDFRLPVVLIAPDGSQQTVNGMIVYETASIDERTGQPVIVHQPAVTVRISSLTRVPVAGETWAVRIPTAPSYTGTKTTFYAREFVDGRSHGWIQMTLIRAEQS